MIKLLPHQIAALERTKKFNNVAYYHDMGLGKTFVGAEKAIRYESERILVVCQKSKINDWIEHFNTHYSLPVFDLSKKKEKKLDSLKKSSRFVRVLDCVLFGNSSKEKKQFV